MAKKAHYKFLLQTFLQKLVLCSLKQTVSFAYDLCMAWMGERVGSNFHTSNSLKTNRLKKPIPLFIMWTTIILVKSTNDLEFDQYNGCPHYEQYNWLF